ncbi:hypothetical protein M8J77_000202 [Diaphorina citri]|nr:hypothetical protein M8J77_000202 [Diaphorina citri]
MRWKHPDLAAASTHPKPMRSLRVSRSTTPGSSSQSAQQSPDPLQCDCGRTFKNKAGLGNHKRANKCSVMSRN